MNSEELGTLIRSRRNDLGVDQRALADLAGVSVHTLSNLESGKGNPTLDVMKRILETLGMELVARVRDPGGPP